MKQMHWRTASTLCMAVAGATVSHTDAGFNWRLQVHTVTTYVTEEVSLQAWHNWAAVSMVNVLLSEVVMNQYGCDCSWKNLVTC